VHQYARNCPDIIKSWWRNPEKFRTDAHGIYATTSLDVPMVYVALMLCRLFGKKSPTHFSVEWVSIMHEVAEGFTFNWAKMLSDNLAKEIAEYKTTKSKGQPAPFYMSTYIMDAICFMTPFPLMNWSWTQPVSSPFISIIPNYGKKKPKISFMKSVTCCDSCSYSPVWPPTSSNFR
jgi:hypothetical protein